MIIVSDTSALGNLAIVNHLWLLQTIYGTVLIPDVVAQELNNKCEGFRAIAAADREGAIAQHLPHLLTLWTFKPSTTMRRAKQKGRLA